MILSIWFVLLNISWNFFLLPLQLSFYIYCLVLWFLVVFQIFCIFFLYILSIFQFNSLSIYYAMSFSLTSCAIWFIVLLLPSLYFSVIYSFSVFIFSTLFNHNRISGEDTIIIIILSWSSIVVEYPCLNLLRIFCSSSISFLGIFVLVFCTVLMEVSIVVVHLLQLSWSSSEF